MSYIEKEKLIRADIASIENKVRHAFNQGYDLGYKDGKKRAKPQEQEPIDYKAQYERFSKKAEIVISQLRSDRDRLLEVLDKVRAEIEPTRKMYLEMNDIDWLNGCDYVLSVIDKHKKESEE